jgi:hypothetical protein
MGQSTCFSRSKDFGPGLSATNLLLYLARIQSTTRPEPSIYVRGNSPLFLLIPPEEPAKIGIAQAILDALEHYPFSSIRELASLTCISTTTVHRHLRQSLGFVAKHLRLVPAPSHLLKKPSVPLSQLGSCASSGPSNTTVGSSFSLLTSLDFIFLQTMRIWLRVDRCVPSKTQKWR